MRTGTTAWRWAMAAVLAGAPGCYRGNQAGVDGGEAGDAGDASGSEGDAGEDGEAACAAEALPPAFMRRLTHGEYRNSVEDLLGADLPDPTLGFPQEPVILGFDNNREAIATSDVLVERYRDAAEVYAAAVVEDAARREAVVGCDAAQDGCLEQFVRRFGRLAYRRPLEDDEVAALVALGLDAAAEDPEPELATRVVLEALLQSPSFLYRVELGTPDPEDPERLVLSGYEVATRLSYLVLASTPPAALLDAAEAGELDDADGVESAARDLLTDPRAPARLGSFYRQWLDLVELPAVVRAPEEYPGWGEPLRASMQEEARRLLEAHLLGGGDLLDVLVSQSGWVDAELAALYGVPAPADGWAEVTFAPEHERGGLLTTAAILTVTGREGVTTPIERGKFMREAFLCDTMPPPPPDIPMVPAPQAGQSERERLEQHREDPACAGCHDMLEPLGFGLARYDAIGALRTVDEEGQPISAEGSFDGRDPDFDGAAELAAALHDDPEVSACVVRQVHRYAFGRGETPADECALEDLHARFEEEGRSFEALVIALVRSDAFRHRTQEED
jgi:Protein of unknown function (DUF1588)/Protein of unknown function (DUF1592)/Protein of unknown function (DUF1595)/Protein of unknown function (DUF1587)/Protein of unknown function (DUF1585)